MQPVPTQRDLTSAHVKMALLGMGTTHVKTSENAATVMDAIPMLNAPMPTDHTHANVTMGSLEMDSLAQTSKTAATVMDVTTMQLVQMVTDHTLAHVTMDSKEMDSFAQTQ